MLPLIEKIDYVICYFLSLSFNTDINIFLGISINLYYAYLQRLIF